MHSYPSDTTPLRISGIVHEHMGIPKHVSSKVCWNIAHAMHAILVVTTKNGWVLIHHGLAGAVDGVAAHVVIHDCRPAGRLDSTRNISSKLNKRSRARGNTATAKMAKAVESITR